jgi:DNA helicase-4
VESFYNKKKKQYTNISPFYKGERFGRETYDSIFNTHKKLDSRKLITQEYLPKIIFLLDKLDEITNYNNYLDNFILQKWKKETSIVIDKIKDIWYYFSDQNNEIYYGSILKNIFDKLEEFKTEYNQEYIKIEIKRGKLYFNLDKPNPTSQQLEIIVSDEVCNYINAGAGCGKTETILNKCKYLIDERNIQPEDILILSYNDSIKKEIIQNFSLNKNYSRIEVQTYHSKGNELLGKPKKASFIENKNRLIFLNEIFEDKLKDKEFSENFGNYFAYYLNEEKLFDDFKNYQEYKDYVSSYEMWTLKNPNEYVKSNQERNIANFLFKHNIEYEYEKSVFGNKKTDFFLPDYNVYIEHWGFNRCEIFLETKNVTGIFKELSLIIKTEIRVLKNYNCEIKCEIAKINLDNNTRIKLDSISILKTTNNEGFIKILKEELKINDQNINVKYQISFSLLKYTPFNNYIKNYYIKIQKYKKENLVLIETFSDLFTEDLLKLLKNQLIDNKIKLSNEKSGLEIINHVNNLSDSTKIRRFTSKLFSPCINVYKSSLKSKIEIESKINYERDKIFLNIFFDLFDSYEKRKGGIDFTDMIVNSTMNKYKPNKFKYILVDEFQDISIDKLELLKYLITPDYTKLYCFGDDWQTINVWSGADINYILDFKGTFINLYNTYKSFTLNKTFRFGKKITDISNKIIKKNKSSLDKKLFSPKGISTGYRLIAFDVKEITRIEKVKEVVRNIRDENQNSEILILSRYSNDIYDKLFNHDKKITCLTIHKSKGRTVDYVILDNLEKYYPNNEGHYGFPSEINTDSLMKLFINSNHDLKLEEERRLLYVAITRARKGVAILYNKKYPSDFVYEFDTKLKSLICPNCGGNLLLRKDNNYGCSNFRDSLMKCSYRLNPL